MIATAVFVTVFATPARMARLPLRSLLKDEFGLTVTQMAQFFALAGLAWYLKPVAGILSDHLSIGERRRTPYIIMSALGGALTWASTAILPVTQQGLLALMALVNVFAVLGNAAAGGLLVDAGRVHQATGRLSSVRVIAMNTGSLIGGPLGGWLAGQIFPMTCGVAGLLALIMLAVVLAGGTEPRPTQAADLRGQVLGSLARMGTRRVWSVMLLSSALYAVPSFSSIMYYYQRDALNITDQQIGYLIALNCSGGMLGALLYSRLTRVVPFGRLLVAGVCMGAVCALIYLKYTSLTAAFVIEPIVGFCVVVSIMPIHELTARASPPKSEAFVFASILALANAAIALSDVLGSSMYEAFGFRLQDMVLIKAVSLLACLPLLLLVPKELLVEEQELATEGASDRGRCRPSRPRAGPR